MVTLIIPTLNRPDFLLRTLSYFAACGFDGELLIGDSSGPGHTNRVKSFLRDAGSVLNVTYREWPGLNDVETLRRLASLAETQYVALLGDDDVLFPHALATCIEFLDANPGFVAAHGHARLFTIDANGIHGQISLGGTYPLPATTADSPLSRLDQLLNNYGVTLFSVHRTSVWQAMWRDVDRIGDRAFGAEILPCCRSAILGKTARLDTPYLLRQVHPARYLLHAKTPWMQAPGWQVSFALVCEALAEDIRSASGARENPSATHLAELFRRTYLAEGLSAIDDHTDTVGAKPGVAAGISDLRKTLMSALKQFVRRHSYTDTGIRKIRSRWRMARARAMMRRVPGTSRDLDLFVKIAAGTPLR